MKIIIAFPGTGKSYAANFLNNQGISARDFDSKEIIKNANWEKEYVDNIMNLYSKDELKYLFISFNETVIKLLSEEELDINIVIPEYSQPVKEMMFGRYLLRDGGFEHIKWLKNQAERYDRCKSENILKYAPNASIYYIDYQTPYIIDIEGLVSL